MILCSSYPTINKDYYYYCYYCNTGRIAEHPGTVAEQLNITRNTSGTPVEHPGTTETYKTKNNCCVLKRKFKTQNINFQLKVEILFLADIVYLFIYFCLFKVG